MESPNVVSNPASFTEQANALWEQAIVVTVKAVHGVVIGWNALPQGSQLLLAGTGVFILLLAIRRSLRIRKLLRVNRAMAATLEDPFYRTVTLKTPADYERS